MSKQLDQTLHNMAYHKPTSEDVMVAIEYLRANFSSVACIVDDAVPDGREKAISFTNLEDALQYAIAGIVRNQ